MIVDTLLYERRVPEYRIITWMDKTLLGSDSVNTLKRTQHRSTSVYCSLLGKMQRNNEFAEVSAATVAMQ
jgi:hypothetical protein